MIQSNLSQADPESFLKQLHERPHQPIGKWLRAPAHVHYKAFRLSDPPTQRPASRTEFQSLLSHLKVPAETTYVRGNFGYGVKEAGNGERLIVLWEAHTEYYNYQLWHMPSQANSPSTFGSLTFPEYTFPLEPLGSVVCRLDILLATGIMPSRHELRGLMPGPILYGSRIFNEQTCVATNFTPDEQGRERYWISVGPSQEDPSRLKDYHRCHCADRDLLSFIVDAKFPFLCSH